VVRKRQVAPACVAELSDETGRVCDVREHRAPFPSRRGVASGTLAFMDVAVMMTAAVRAAGAASAQLFPAAGCER
jgi:hypothetical protein